MRFEAGAYRDAVDVKFDKGWYRGRLVSLVLGSEVLGVAFEDGDWAADVCWAPPRCKPDLLPMQVSRHAPVRRSNSHSSHRARGRRTIAECCS